MQVNKIYSLLKGGPVIELSRFRSTNWLGVAQTLLIAGSLGEIRPGLIITFSFNSYNVANLAVF